MVTSVRTGSTARGDRRPGPPSRWPGSGLPPDIATKPRRPTGGRNFFPPGRYHRRRRPRSGPLPAAGRAGMLCRIPTGGTTIDIITRRPTDGIAMSAADPVTLWITQVKEGQRSAVDRLLARYFRRLVQLARARLRGVPGLAGCDEDVALSAFKSLCLRAERGRFPRLADRTDLWRLPAVLTVRKAIDLQRRRRPEEVPDPQEVLAREPPPELEAELAEEYRRLLDRLGDAQLRAVA